MNRKCWIIVALLLVLMSQGIQAQLRRPNPPYFDYLTINLDNGHPTLSWSKEDFDPLCENTTGYIIYKYFKIANINNCKGNCAIDTVASNIFSYTDTNSDGNIDTLTYNIATWGTTQASPLQKAHSSIFITSFYDSCNAKLDLSWSLYGGWANNTIHAYYYLYVGNTNNWSSYILKDSIDRFSGHYSLKNIDENQHYYCYLIAKRTDKPFTSYSNLYHRFTKMPIHPSYMSIDSIIAEDRKVNMYFKIDPATELSDFQVVRWENSDSIKSIFSKKILDTFPSPSTNYYADTVDSWAARTRPFYYKIDALNTCPNIVKVTNHTNTIIPFVHSTWHTCHITWNELFIDSNRVKIGNYPRYRVIRYAYTTVPMPPVYFPETDKLEVIDTVHIFEGQGYSAEFCYIIEAYEKNNLGANVMLSRSRKQCTDVIPGVIMPDAIAPSDNTVGLNGNARNILTPIITFKANYTLSIYNRWGNLVFYGVNTGWNGRIPGGALAREGTYVYRLIVTTTGNQDVVKTGNITVIYH